MPVALQFYIILFMIGLDVSLDTNTINYIGGRRVITQHKGKNTALIITNSVGLLFNAAWCFAAYLAVKWESQRWTTTLQVLAPISYIMPIVDILLGETFTLGLLPLRARWQFQQFLVVMDTTSAPLSDALLTASEPRAAHEAASICSTRLLHVLCK